MVDVLYSHESDIPEYIYEFIESNLLPSLVGCPPNYVIAITLGGSYSKNLSNSRSDIDLNIYYATSVKNLLGFRRIMVSIMPRGFEQVRSDPTIYEHKGNLYEVNLIPIRRMGEGNDLLMNLKKNNMKTIHELIKNYIIYVPKCRLPKKEFVYIINQILNGEFELSVESIVGYFRGYATSQLMSHRRRTDFDRAIRKSEKENSVGSVIKTIMNGIYIGLSGLLMLDKAAVSRDFYSLWKTYEYIFNNDERKFIEEIYLYKTDKKSIDGRSIRRIIRESILYRESIFYKITDQYDISKELAIRQGRFKETPNQKKNDEILESIQARLLRM